MYQKLYLFVRKEIVFFHFGKGVRSLAFYEMKFFYFEKKNLNDLESNSVSYLYKKLQIYLRGVAKIYKLSKKSRESGTNTMNMFFYV